MVFTSNIFADNHNNKSNKITAQEIADLFYKVGGDPKDSHRKVNHNKGFCTSGEFIPNKALLKEYNIPILEQDSIPSLVRYSLGGGNPKISDKDKSRGIAIKMDGKEPWVLVMSNA
ncbi:hypothetical protein [Helicobacter sp. MIT 14-3879]|uniref:hypothetical protein n=1 Tax=Helicobacter sp. MIT 14-3879 TaxID=2040649 RepID=UPI000E1F9FD0|nr:hypothetical protein [Helicobacter sp. MIT 14-3879]RDU65107.1 hypothetical protein CQA44_01995 [Helicobacter sp. MIT 14-3879]